MLSQKKYLWITIISFIAVSLLLAGGIVVVKTGALDRLTGLFHREETVMEPGEAGSGSQETLEDQTVVLPKLENRMLGATLVPAVDFPVEGSVSEITNMLDSRLDAIAQYGMNTVVMPASVSGKALFHSLVLEAANSELDFISYVLSGCRSRNLELYLTLDLSQSAGETVLRLTDEGDVDTLCRFAEEVAKGYDVDAVLLDNYQNIQSPAQYAAYQQSGGGMGYDAWIRQSTDAAVSEIRQSLRKASPYLYVGLYAGPVWRNQADDARGSETSVDAAATDYARNADTRKWVSGKTVDFVLVKNNTAQDNAAQSFNKVAQWWNQLGLDTDVPIYMVHSADKVCSAEQGWKSPDQLSRQVLFLKDLQGIYGSVFDSISHLAADQTGSTKTLVQMFAGSVDTAKLLDDLTFLSPSKTTMTTKESKISFSGISDTNFPLLLNGEECPRSEDGAIALEKTLNPGLNTFRFEHKGKVVEFKITYKIVVLSSISPASAVTVDGGSAIVVRANAQRGAKVTATLNKKTITLNAEVEDKAFEAGDFVEYTGEFTAPAATDSNRNLGSISFKGAFQGLTDTMKSGSVTVNKRPSANVDIGDLDPSKGDIDTSELPKNIDIDLNRVLEHGAAGATAGGKLVEITAPFGEGMRDFPAANKKMVYAPTITPLPKGTQMISLSTKYDGSVACFEFLKNTFFSQKEVKVVADGANMKLDNEITMVSAGQNGRHTNLVLDVKWHAPFRVEYLPQAYANEAQRNFAVSSAQMEYIDITFDYAVKLTGNVSFSGHPLFSSAETLVKDNKIVLRLHLKKKGAFFGYDAQYSTDGKLVFTFLHPASVGDGGSPLKNMVIVLDPGHGGYPRDGETAQGASGITTDKKKIDEKDINLTLAKKLKNQLESMGARVIMTREGDDIRTYQQRNVTARNVRPDLYLAIHHNSAASSKAKGLEAYYFTPFSKNFSQRVYDNVLEAFGKSGDRGNRFGVYYMNRVTFCPSVLMEYGYMSNVSECTWISQDGTADQFAAKTAAGILEYLKSIQ